MPSMDDFRLCRESGSQRSSVARVSSSCGIVSRTTGLHPYLFGILHDPVHHGLTCGREPEIE